MGLHRCTEAECPYLGQTTSRGCGCHKSDEQVYRDIAGEMLSALEEIKRNNGQYNFGSKLLRIVLPVIAQARAAGIEPKE